MKNESKAKTNAEVRQWYLEQVARIPELNEQWLKQKLSAQERAERAWRMRHEFRLQARAMMADPAEVELLRQRDIAKYGNPYGPTFEYLVKKLQGSRAYGGRRLRGHHKWLVQSRRGRQPEAGILI